VFSGAVIMLIQFNAYLLLDDPWWIDINRIAALVAQRFPAIGRVEAVPGATPGAGLLTIDNGMLVVLSLPHRLSDAEIWPTFAPLQSWDPRGAVAAHRGHIVISCGGDNLPGIDGAKAFAATVTLVAAALAEVAPVTAVLWQEGSVLMSLSGVAAAAERLHLGRLPVSAWVSFVPVTAAGQRPEHSVGMLTHGMALFAGRELELAPAPIPSRLAFEQTSDVANRVLEDGLVLTEGGWIEDPATGEGLLVRTRSSWWRRGVPAFVLLRQDALVDPDTLEVLRGPGRRRFSFSRTHA
jgi:hypothetical protein